MFPKNDTQAPHGQRRWFRCLDDDPRAVVTARALTSTALEGWEAGLVADAVLVTSELVTNAIAHGTAPVILTVTTWTEPEPTVVIDVADTSPTMPVEGLPGETGHFGLWIAEELARITVHPAPCGKTVRATFGTVPDSDVHSPRGGPYLSRPVTTGDAEV